MRSKSYLYSPCHLLESSRDITETVVADKMVFSATMREGILNLVNLTFFLLAFVKPTLD